MANWTSGAFSDRVIGAVQARALGAERFVDPSPREPSAFQPSLRRDPIEAARAVADLGTRPRVYVHDRVAARMSPLERLLGHAEEPKAALESLSLLTTEPRVGSPTAREQAKVPKKRVRVKTERRKEQCRTNQARYRNKQRLHRIELENTVIKLREEVSELDQHYRSLSYRVCSSHNIWSVVVEYFRLFRHGISIFAGVERQPTHKMNPPLVTESAPATPSWNSLIRTSPTGQSQVEFLKAVMAPDLELVTSGDYGVDALVDHWLRWVRCFQDFELQLDRIEQAPGVADAVLATARISATITSATIRKVFGHLLESEDQQLDNELAWRLCGQRIEIKCSVWFECDSQSNQVQRLRSEAALIPAVHRLVASLTDTARVLDGALITSGGFLVAEDA